MLFTYSNVYFDCCSQNAMLTKIRLDGAQTSVVSAKQPTFESMVSKPAQ